MREPSGAPVSLEGVVVHGAFVNVDISATDYRIGRHLANKELLTTGFHVVEFQVRAGRWRARCRRAGWRDEQPAVAGPPMQRDRFCERQLPLGSAIEAVQHDRVRRAATRPQLIGEHLSVRRPCRRAKVPVTMGGGDFRRSAQRSPVGGIHISDEHTGMRAIVSEVQGTVA